MQQTQINFERSEQLGLVRGAELPAAGNIKPDKLKAVLRVIDDHAGQQGWCYASQPTIAREACLPLRTVERAIVVLRDHLGVILTERRQSPGGTVVNHARIVWTELALLCEPHRSRRAVSDQVPSQPIDELGDDCESPRSPELRLWNPTDTVADHPAKSIDHPASSGGMVPVDHPAKTEDHPAKTEDHPANTGGFNRKRFGSAQEAPPPTPSWAAAAEALDSCGVRMVARAISEAKERGHPPDAVLTWCAEFRRWSFRFDGPAAILWRIREGCWPVELPDATTFDRQRVAAVERERQRVFDRILYLGRRSRLPTDEITRQLRAELPAEFLACQTW